jgi:hypothetical protein
MATLPTNLLQDVYWSFAEPVLNSPEELINALREYAAELDVPDASANLLQPLPFGDVRVSYSYGYRTDSGDWRGETKELRVVAPPPSRLTGAALLWELHVACHATVGAQDRHYFEGFELLSQAGGGAPAAYEIILGS